MVPAASAQEEGRGLLAGASFLSSSAEDAGGKGENFKRKQPTESRGAAMEE